MRLVSAVATGETIAALCRAHHGAPAAAEAAVPRFLAEIALTCTAIGPREAALAAAYAAFGRGRHPAALNMGDGFAYAGAKASNAA